MFVLADDEVGIVEAREAAHDPGILGRSRADVVDHDGSGENAPPRAFERDDPAAQLRRVRLAAGDADVSDFQRLARTESAGLARRDHRDEPEGRDKEDGGDPERSHGQPVSRAGHRTAIQ